MLRTMVFIVSLTVGLVGLGACLAGHADATPAALWGGFIAVALLVERWRYRAATTAGVPGGDWHSTGERFVDPESGRTLQVLFNPRTGERRYEEHAPG